MKAKDYVSKHYDALTVADFHFDPPKTPEEKERIIKEIDERQRKAIAELLIDLNKEVAEIRDRRGVKTDTLMVAILREMNDKWNAICDQIEKRYGSEILLHDGFKMYWIDKRPEIKPFWNR